MLLLFFWGGGPYYIQLQKIIPQNFLTLNLVSPLFGGGVRTNLHYHIPQNPILVMKDPIFAPELWGFLIIITE